MIALNKPNIGNHSASIGRIEKTPFVPVYTNQFQLWFEKAKVHPVIKYAKNKSGVYYIKEEGNLVYVGHSTYDLYTVILSHFQRGQFSRISNYHEELHEKGMKYTVRIVFLSPEETLEAESILINKLKPRDNQYLTATFKANPKNASERYKDLARKIDRAPAAQYDDVPF